ncbi:hypothetical protein KY289_008462 [Solanum tuberosum]|nr:hypothetical protein KY289_008462 [Solanum tuberosum]
MSMIHIALAKLRNQLSGIAKIEQQELSKQNPFYQAIQSLQYQKAPSNVDESVEAVERSFDEMKVEQLNHVFLTLQSCMIEVMKDNGGNNYKVPHLNKNGLERQDNLPLQHCCDIGT